ncbi:hypothetical protein [Salinicoccus halitifaciens]|uniref:Major membrane immunogen (Membrane-anchored lipoprotein) n=1 Tax=Salinicoccus halitifaciens TaxID=1073415 RepID=A0ABV2E9K1_9STAP|nr:hypothetical protein [Salinicoccus halitifaciens]MCD2138229.1 hypothetical protein [Salinicoccus halitifaciens]
MKRFSFGMLMCLAIFMSGCSEDDFNGRTFKVIDSTNFLETRTEFDSEEERGELLSLTFDSGEVIINSAKHLKGKYKAVDDQLEITLVDHQGELLLVFSDLASSVEKDVKYTAEISDLDYSLDANGDLAQLKLIEMYDREGMVVFFEETGD